MKALYFDNDTTKIIALKAASVFSRFAALGPISPLSYADVPTPEMPNERWLRVRNQACGLCGTDVHFMFMEMDPLCFPAAIPGVERKFLGHELVGVVEKVGAEVEGFKTGDRVGLRIDWPSCNQLEIDPPCPQCGKGRYLLCENLGTKKPIVRDVGGGFSPKMIMHRTQPFLIPDSLPKDKALMIEPTASTLHGLLRRTPRAGEKVLVIGAGTIGLLCTLLVRALCPDATVHTLARHEFQATFAKRMGAHTVFKQGRDLYAQIAKATGAKDIQGMFGNRILLGGYDLIYDTVGNDRSIQDALRLAKGGGDVVILGINFQPGKIDYTPIWNQEVTVYGMNSHGKESDGESSFEKAIALILEKDLPVDRLITHRFPMNKWKSAVRLFLNKKKTGAVKIVLEHE